MGLIGVAESYAELSGLYQLQVAAPGAVFVGHGDGGAVLGPDDQSDAVIGVGEVDPQTPRPA
jgi:hypothetical protein